MPPAKFIGLGGTWQRIVDRWVGLNGAWLKIRESYVALGGQWNLIYRRVFIITITEDHTAFNIGQGLLFEGWDGVSPVDWILYINTGVVMRSTGVGFGEAAINDDGIGWPVGSTGYINNFGLIIGKGGAGGVGGNLASPAGNPGQPGSDAIVMHLPLTINNQGYIFGGGGGGGGGAEKTVIS